MVTKLVDGKKIADEVFGNLQKAIQNFKDSGHVPKLAVVVVGENPASLAYINMKQKRGEDIGVSVQVWKFSENVEEADLRSRINILNHDPELCGILVQLPLPGHLNSQTILDLVDPELDVDCLTSTNKQKLTMAEDILFLPPAPAAIIKILDYYKVDLKDSNVLIVGSGDLVGRPLASMFIKKHINFNLANRHTNNWQDMAIHSDVVITAVGQAKLITGKFIKPGAVVIDAGTTGSGHGQVVGDVDTQSVLGVAGLLAAVPGGVGPVTIAMLFSNVVQSVKKI